LVWLHGEVRTPPFSEAARREAGLLLRRLQRGEYIGMPHAVIILAVFAKKTPRTPHDVIDVCRHRLRKYDAC